MKKVFNEKDIDSLLFKIKKNGMETMRRIIFPLSKKELNKKLNEISDLSQGNSVVRPSLVTNDGVAYHLNDDDVIKEIKQSKETVHGKGEIKIITKDIERSHDESFEIQESDNFSVSLEVKELYGNSNIKNSQEINQKLLNQSILDSLPSNKK